MKRHFCYRMASLFKPFIKQQFGLTGNILLLKRPQNAWFLHLSAKFHPTALASSKTKDFVHSLCSQWQLPSVSCCNDCLMTRTECTRRECYIICSHAVAVLSASGSLQPVYWVFALCDYIWKWPILKFLLFQEQQWPFLHNHVENRRHGFSKCHDKQFEELCRGTEWITERNICCLVGSMLSTCKRFFSAAHLCYPVEELYCQVHPRRWGHYSKFCHTCKFAWT